MDKENKCGTKSSFNKKQELQVVFGNLDMVPCFSFLFGGGSLT